MVFTFTKLCFLWRMPYYGRILKYTYSNILLTSLTRERKKFKKRTFHIEHSRYRTFQIFTENSTQMYNFHTNIHYKIQYNYYRNNLHKLNLLCTIYCVKFAYISLDICHFVYFKTKNDCNCLKYTFLKP